VTVDDGRVLALDLGTSSVRALIFDGEGRPVPGAIARRPTRLLLGEDGKAELDPEAMVALVGACLDELAAAGALDAVELVAMSSAWHSVLAADPAGRPLSGLLTWADTRAAALVAKLRQRVDAERLHQRTGAPPHDTFWTVKLPWLAEQVPAAARYLGLAEYVTGRLLGDASASVSMASGTGLLNLDTIDWDAEALELAGVTPAALPALAPEGWTGRLQPQWARRWPQLAAVPWHPATGDGAASNVGAGCTTPRWANVNIGTSAAIRVVHEPPAGRLHQRLWRYRVDRSRLVTGEAFSGGGNLFAWARGALRLPDGHEPVEAALAAVPPGAEGVTALPYHAGARAPLDLPAGSGSVAGLSLATTPTEILAALLEAVCYQLADGFDALSESLREPPEVVASGGAVVASPWWQQTLADVLAQPVRVVDEPEASARGAAVLALGRSSEPDTLHVVRPRPEAVAAQRGARRRNRELAERLGAGSPVTP
jgi:gluconokinase